MGEVQNEGDFEELHKSHMEQHEGMNHQKFYFLLVEGSPEYEFLAQRIGFFPKMYGMLDSIKQEFFEEFGVKL